MDAGEKAPPDFVLREGPLPVTLLIVPRFSLLSLAICTDGLRLANRESLRPVFAWTIATADGAPAVSSSGLPVAPQAALDDIAHAPVTILLASYDPEAACTPALLAWLRRQDRRGGVIGCVDTAACILAKAGLLRGERIAVHHEVAAPYRETLGDAVLLDHLYAFEGRRLSSAGGMATLDMLLALIARLRGNELARRVATVMNHTPWLDRVVRNELPRDGALLRIDRRLARLVELMQSHLDEPLQLIALCRLAGVEESTARRLFRRHLGTGPAAYYLQLRLGRARALLAYGHAPVKEIALAVGFADTASFSHAFKRRYGLPPSRARHDESGAARVLL